MMNLKTFAAAAIAVTGALGAGLAQARTDVQWSVNIGVPIYAQPVYVEPAPVYVQPRPVYVQPAPVYYGRPAPAYAYRYPTRWDRDADGIPDRYERRQYEQPRHWDRDRDGVPDRYDRRPDNPWRR